MNKQLTSSASLYKLTCDCRPVRLKSSSMKSSDTSAKYSCPRREQKDEIHDSGLPDEVDILSSGYPMTSGRELRLSQAGIRGW